MPDRVVGAAVDVDAGRAVPERGGAGGGRADAVALDHVAVAVDPDPVQSVPRDDVALVQRVAAHDHARVRQEIEAAVSIADRLRPGYIRADPVALDLDVRAVDRPDLDPPRLKR